MVTAKKMTKRPKRQRTPLGDNVMLDLETLGNKSGCAILSIGATAFTAKEITAETHIFVSAENSAALGLGFDVSTVLWWMGQSEAARQSLLEGQKKALPVVNALAAFTGFINDATVGIGGVKVWGNGASFDNTILSHVYALLGVPRPWQFWNDRCYRTIKNQYSDVHFIKPRVAHDALEDARAQTIHLLNIHELHSTDAVKIL